MKNYLIKLLTIVLCIGAAPICHAEKKFQKVAEINGVESVYMGKAIIQMAFRTSSQVNIANIMQLPADIAERINSIEVLKCGSVSKMKSAKRTAGEIIQSMNLEVLLEGIKNDSEMTIIYGQPINHEGSEHIKNLIIEVIKNNKYSLIYIDGIISFNKLNVNLNL